MIITPNKNRLGTRLKMCLALSHSQILILFLCVVALHSYAQSSIKGLPSSQSAFNQTGINQPFTHYNHIDGIIYSFGIEATVCGLSNANVGTLHIPDEVKYRKENERKEEKYKVGEIRSNAFEDCDKLISVTISGNVHDLGVGVFKNCINLSSVEFKSPPIIKTGDNVATSVINTLVGMVSSSVRKPKRIESIPDETFYGCENLTSISIPIDVKNIGSRAFLMSGIKSLPIHNNIRSIGDFAFSSCVNLNTIYLPSSINHLGQGAFSDCMNLVDVTIESNLTILNPFMFSDCKKLTYVNIPNIIKIIDESAFEGCNNLLYIKLPDSLTNIQKFAFDGCGSLTSIVIPENVKKIDDFAFSGCTSLKHVEFSNNVDSIGEGIFYDCNQLKSIRIKSINPPVAGHIFTSEPQSLYIPRGCREKYLEQYPWNTIKDIIEE